MRTNKPQRVAKPLAALLNNLPEDKKREYLVGRRVKQIQEQFASCVDPFILDHVNSVYLIKSEANKTDSKNDAQGIDSALEQDAPDVSRETIYDLTVYVDNSLIAAELNAQRELIILKYRELFSERIDTFSIKISRGHYLNRYPYRSQEDEKTVSFHQLSKTEEEEIEKSTALISDADIRASFQRALKAIKEHPLKK